MNRIGKNTRSFLLTGCLLAASFIGGINQTEAKDDRNIAGEKTCYFSSMWGCCGNNGATYCGVCDCVSSGG